MNNGCVCLTVCILALNAPGVAADPASLLLLPPLPGDFGFGLSSPQQRSTNGETLSAMAGVSVTRSVSARRQAAPDIGLTVQRRRWSSLATASGLQPMTWGMKGDVSAQLSLGLQSELFYTDNIKYSANSGAVGATVFELTPIIRLDVGDPQEGAMSQGRLSSYYAGLLYVPTVRRLLETREQKVLQHFFGEIGRLTEITRISLRLDYDERILSSSDDTSLEDTYTLLEASGLLEHHFTPKTMLRTKLTCRDISVDGGLANRLVWIGEAGLEWAATAKMTVGLGTELGLIEFERSGLGSQNYQQALLLGRWKPTAKINVTARVGPEWRDFNGGTPKAMQITPVGAVALQWLATENTRINTRLRVGNEPSIVQQGALFREYRLGSEIMHDLGIHWYLSTELQFVRRNYDSGRRESEPVTRLLLGYRESPDRAASRLNIEFYVQWRERKRHGNFEAADRSQIGLQVTKFF